MGQSGAVQGKRQIRCATNKKKKATQSVAGVDRIFPHVRTLEQFFLINTHTRARIPFDSWLMRSSDSNKTDQQKIIICLLFVVLAAFFFIAVALPPVHVRVARNQ